ncbi:Bifunctional inhibitor/plant lipid transfer protein/seed storage helical domain-containing protein [Hirschfeldia incana]|nr:Bifunctional inhibitor/plant lipid transfer protein/seed storage helical domain-containing protein [Hirschfeldia incana]
MKFTGVVCIASVIVLVSFLAPTTKAALEEKVACNSFQLSVTCIPEGQTGTPPSAQCCRKLKEQTASCLCKFIGIHLFPPPADMYDFLAACGLPAPTCVN